MKSLAEPTKRRQKQEEGFNRQNHYVSRKRVRDDSDEFELDSPEVKRLRDDLLCILDDSDPLADKDPATHDLASVMKIFEEQISASPPRPVPVVDLTSDSGESQPDISFLLEASDDELGLPPSCGLSEFWGFGDEIPSYDSFEFGFGETHTVANNYGEYVALEGLFDHSDISFGSTDFSEFSWRHETLPAL
ncbi:unnamed protein product, partial [Vitis vinifera]